MQMIILWTVLSVLLTIAVIVGILWLLKTAFTTEYDKEFPTIVITSLDLPPKGFINEEEAQFDSIVDTFKSDMDFLFEKVLAELNLTRDDLATWKFLKSGEFPLVIGA